MEREAIIDPTGRYRYNLLRVWDGDRPRICFVMLNPSTADHLQDDPTIRRCIGFARSWGGGSLEVVNLFALRSTRPEALRTVADPVGPENDGYISLATGRAAITVAAWGAHGALRLRDRAVLPLLREPVCLGVTGGGFPRHPLYVAGSAAQERYGGRPEHEIRLRSAEALP